MKNEIDYQDLIQEIKLTESDFLKDLRYLLSHSNLAIKSLSEYYFELGEYSEKAFISNLESANIPLKQEFRKLPLGKYAEELLKFYFKNSNDWKLIKANQVVYENSKSVGEIDFIIQNTKDCRFTHLEFAIKFYLLFKDEFIGLNPKDNLRNKVNKLLHKQLPLFKKYKYQIAPKLINHAVESKVLLKGAFFYPIHLFDFEQNNLNNGWWCYRLEMNKVVNNRYLFEIVENKQDWIFPFKRKKLMEFDTCLANLKEMFLKKREVMICRYSLKEGLVHDRGFIVSDEWPNLF
tara:strand:- start:1168 stop:2040 length:873 start_codon:yes stop_codon:yes gene_type:complete